MINLYLIITILIVLKDHLSWAVFEAQMLNVGLRPILRMHPRLWIPTGRRQTSDGNFLAWRGSWVRNYRESNPASGDGRTWTRNLRNAWTTLWPFGHTASICAQVFYIPLNLHCLIAQWWLPCDHPWSIYSIDNFLRTFKCWMPKESGTGLQCSCKGL